MVVPYDSAANIECSSFGGDNPSFTRDLPGRVYDLVCQISTTIFLQEFGP
jgi:hypothetical protein